MSPLPWLERCRRLPLIENQQASVSRSHRWLQQTQHYGQVEGTVSRSREDGDPLGNQLDGFTHCTIA